MAASLQPAFGLACEAASRQTAPQRQAEGKKQKKNAQILAGIQFKKSSIRAEALPNLS
jgi:hypothetical protein